MSNGPLKPVHNGFGDIFIKMERNESQDQGSSSNRLPPRCPNSTNRPASATKVFGTTPGQATAERATNRIRNMVGSENKAEAPNTVYHFARPVDRRYLESPTTGVKKQKPQSPTRVIPFNLQTTARAKVRGKSETDTESEVTEDLAKCFKPLAVSSAMPDHLPPKQPRMITATMPFQLQTARIGAEHEEKRRKKIEEENEKRRKEAIFRAKVMPDFTRPVFCPALSNCRTEPKQFQSSTAQRAEERREFEEQQKRKEAETMEILRQRELERKRQEEEETRKMRAEMVPKAQPFKNPKPFEVKHIYNDITVPVTPKLETDRRLLHRPPSRGLDTRK